MINRVDRPGVTLSTARFTVLGAVTTFGPLSMDMYLPALPALARSYTASDAATQLTLTACMVGLAGGQLLVGPVSDTTGRRLPMAAGIAVFVATSLLCALAPSISVLIVLRLLQGTAGGGAIAVSRAVVRDVYSGAALARSYALLMLVTGAAPVLAPILGGELLRVTDWRGVFVALAAVGAVILVGVAVALPETLPAARRTPAGLGRTLRLFGRLSRDRVFAGHALVTGFGMATMFAYIAGSPFVLEGRYGLSPRGFAVVFAVNAAGIIGVSQLSGALVGRLGPAALLRIGTSVNLAASAALLVAAYARPDLSVILLCLFVVVSSVGLIMPNATALALHDHPAIAGTAAALLGFAQFIIGAAIAPLVGLAGSASATPLAAITLTLSAITTACLMLAGAGRRSDLQLEG
jgi:MFS transporter, DHA1 family, multidrug resistance protein